jgi:hypothetical protein
MAMDENLHHRNAGEGQPADTDSQAAEPRGRLGHTSEDHPVTPGHRTPVDPGPRPEDPAGQGLRSAAGEDPESGGSRTPDEDVPGDGPGRDEDAGHRPERGAESDDGSGDDSGDGPGDGPGDRRDPPRSDPDDRDGPPGDDLEDDAPGSNRSFLLGLAWWP